jgi:putative tricarboxylic transport membrane protein
MLRELLAATILFAIAVGYYRAASSILASDLADEVGPGGVPLVYAIALAALAALLALRAVLTHFLLRAADMAASLDGRFERRVLTRAAGMLAIGAAYIGLVGVLGYVVMVGAVILAVALYQGERPGWRLGAVALGGALFFWAFFVWLLGIDMPAGFWPLLWGGQWMR